MRSSRIGLVLPAVITIGCLTFATAAARAQTQPTPGAQPGAYQAPPPAMQQPAPPPPMQGQPAGDDAYRGYNGNNGNGYTNDYPAYEVNVVPGARANAVRARLEMEQIQTNMHRWIERSWDDFMHSRDYVDAAATEKKAQDEYARERERVLKRLRDDSNYHALTDLIAETSERIERERPRDMAKANQMALDNFMALATLKLGYASTLSAMETAALSADDGVKNALNKLRDTAGKTRDMRSGFQREVRRNPDFLAARARYDDARINRVVASAYLESLLNARCIALDYAYWVHRWDQYRYSTGY